MTGSELKEFTESVLDGLELDETFYYQLLNIAKTKLEGMRVWQYLKKVNSSNSASSSAITLPTDCAEDYKVMVGTSQEYFPVPFEEQFKYRNSANRYYIDWANGQYYLLGTIRPGTIYFFYKRFTDDITSNTSPVFPARYHALLAFYVAGYYQSGVDSDDIFARMSPENKMAAMELQRAMMAWDTSLALRAQNNQVGVADTGPVEDIASM